MKHSLSDADINKVSQTCHGYVGADLTMLVQEAGLACVRRLIKQKMHNDRADVVDIIGIKDFHAALHKVKPSAMREITFDIPKVYWSDIGGQDDLKKKLQQAIIWPLKYGESFRFEFLCNARASHSKKIIQNSFWSIYIYEQFEKTKKFYIFLIKFSGD
jgi:AAA family ATPase